MPTFSFRYRQLDSLFSLMQCSNVNLMHQDVLKNSPVRLPQIQYTNDIDALRGLLLRNSKPTFQTLLWDLMIHSHKHILYQLLTSLTIQIITYITSNNRGLSLVKKKNMEEKEENVNCFRYLLNYFFRLLASTLYIP